MSSEAIQPTVAPGDPFGRDDLVVETPERVELYYTRAQVGNRFLAAGIDHAIQAFAILAVALALYLVNGLFDSIVAGLGQYVVAAGILVSFAIYTAYFAVFETIWNGQTPGKRICRLRVIREDGRPIRFYEALLRNLVRTFVDAMPIFGVPLYSVGILSIFLSTRSKRVGDYVAGTVVIRESESKAPTLVDLMALARLEANREWGARAGDPPLDVASLTDDDVVAVRAFLRRRATLPQHLRALLAHRLASSLAARLTLGPEPVAPEKLIERVDAQTRATRRSIRRR